MDDDRLAARDRVRGMVGGQHRRLDELFAEVDASFAESGELDAMRDAFAALSEQLDVHFDQEDRLYFGSVGALRPELEPEIRTISDSHRRFRMEIAAIAGQLERGELAVARRGFGALAHGFQRHEALEEALLQRVDAGIRDAP